MYKFSAKCFVAFLFAVLSNASFAQTSTYSNPNSQRENNPYSKYGIGELWNGNPDVLKGMGNITSSYQDAYVVNPDNPASYSCLALTTFQGGGLASIRTITNAAGASYTTGTASLGYLNLGIPINQRGGFSLGLRPFSRTYYALLDTSKTAMGTSIRSYAGDGGLSYAYLGGSYRIKGLSVGFNLGYLFGNYRNFTSVSSDSPSVSHAYEAQFARYTRLGGLYWKGGFIYEHMVGHDTDLHFRIGGTLSLGQNLNERVSNYQVSIYNFGDTLVNDTSKSVVEQKGKLKLPVSYSIGVTLARFEKWSVGVDYSMSDWSKYSSTPDSAFNLGVGKSAYKLSVGGEYTPNMNDMRNYFSRVTYRAGFYYGQDYINLSNTALPVYGFTLGGSFPYKRNTRSHSRLHTSIDVGRIGTHTNNLLQQTYVRFGLGLTFNEKWFIPRRYD